MKGKRIFYIVVCVILLILAAVLCTAGAVQKGKLEGENIARTVGIVIAALIFLARGLIRTKDDNPNLTVYETENKNHIEFAFKGEGQEKLRKELLLGIHYFTIDENQKAINKLEGLLPHCKTDYDFVAVELFLANSYECIGGKQKAIELYRDVVARDPQKSTAWSNLGLIYKELGDIRNALDCLSEAVKTDPKNPYAHNNMAVAFISVGAYDYAIPYAMNALDLKTNMHQASNALAISFNAMSEYEKAEHYFSVSMRLGVEPNGLREAMEKHKDAFVPYDEDEEDEADKENEEVSAQESTDTQESSDTQENKEDGEN